MYCKICGCKIKADEERCPECGSSVTTEYCGGFWDLVDQSKKSQAAAEQRNEDRTSDLLKSGEELYDPEKAPERRHDPEKRRDPDKVRPDSPEERKPLAAAKKNNRGISTGIIAAVAVLCLLVAIIQSVRLGSVKTDLESQKTDLESKNADLNSQITTLQNENEDLQNKIKEYEDQTAAKGEEATEDQNADTTETPEEDENTVPAEEPTETPAPEPTTIPEQ